MSLQLRVLAPEGGGGSRRDGVRDGGDGGLHTGGGEKAALGHPCSQDGVEGAQWSGVGSSCHGYSAVLTHREALREETFGGGEWENRAI